MGLVLPPTSTNFAFCYSTNYMSPTQFIRIHQIIILVDCDIRRGGQASGGVGSAKVFRAEVDIHTDRLLPHTRRTVVAFRPSW